MCRKLKQFSKKMQNVNVKAGKNNKYSKPQLSLFYLMVN